MRQFVLENRYSLITTFLALGGFLWAIVEYILTKKQDITIEALKQQLEFQKIQKSLNDEKFRSSYQDFVSLLFKIMQVNKNEDPIPLEQLNAEMLKFMQTSLLFAGPLTLKAFGSYKKDGTGSDVLRIIGNLILKMREDLGVDNRGIDEVDILQVFIIGNASEELAKLDKTK